jgi:PPOX class probable F420-dependent enzyme
MPTLPSELRQLIESGPLAHLSTINADTSPQVSVVWIGVEGDDLVSAHMRREQLKLRNIERDPRVVVSLEAPREPGVLLAQHAVIRARATIEGPSEDAWELLDRLAKIYIAPDAAFPAPRGAGYVVRYAVERVGGVGPWATR